MYQKGLTGAAVAWKVKKFKGHCSISKEVSLSIEAVKFRFVFFGKLLPESQK